MARGRQWDRTVGSTARRARRWRHAFIYACRRRMEAEGYASSIYEKYHALKNCVGFIDGTVIGIARPKGYELQRAAYNGHKRKHALKFQALNSPDGLVLHVYGPIEGRRHDWTMYTRSGLDDHLSEILEVDSERYCIYGDSGYNRRWFMEVSYQGSHLTPPQVAFNRAMSAVRITVEWIFKELKLYFVEIVRAPKGAPRSQRLWLSG